MLTRRWILCSLTVALVLLLAACSRVATATPTAEATAAATARATAAQRATAALQATLTAAPTVKPSATATEQPSATPTDHPTNPPTATRAATALPSATPTVTPTPYAPERLVFAQDFGLTFINSDGSGRERPAFFEQYIQPYGHGGSVETGKYLFWSPNGDYLAFDGGVNNGTEHRTFIVRTSDYTILATHQTWDTNPSWSPDSENLAFVMSRDVEPGFRPKAKLYVYNLETKSSTKITEGDTDDVFPAWSPTGDWIAFLGITNLDDCIYICDTSLYLVRPDGNGLKLVLENVLFLQADYLAPEWSPNGQWLAVRSLESELVLVNVNTQETRVLNVKADSPPSWSLDGRSLVFGSDFSGNPEIYSIQFDGGQLINLTNSSSEEWWPVYSSTGQYIAFSSYDSGMNTSSNCVMYADGSNRNCLEPGRHVFWVIPATP